MICYSVNNSDIVAFADDVTLIIWDDNIHGLVSSIEHGLSAIDSWCKQMKLTISATKTNLLYLYNHKKLLIKHNDITIEPSE